jgi:hypothetical protein
MNGETLGAGTRSRVLMVDQLFRRFQDIRVQLVDELFVDLYSSVWFPQYFLFCFLLNRHD